jgi:hypothetical protein
MIVPNKDICLDARLRLTLSEFLPVIAQMTPRYNSCESEAVVPTGWFCKSWSVHCEIFLG